VAAAIALCFHIGHRGPGATEQLRSGNEDTAIADSIAAPYDDGYWIASGGESSTELALPLDQMTAAEKLRTCAKRYLDIQFPEDSNA
jgi:hypothetical protein